MGDSGPKDGTGAPDPVFIEHLTRVLDAGNDLAEAAHRVSRTYDGVHRLRLALAGWYQTLADEYGRGTDSPKEARVSDTVPPRPDLQMCPAIIDSGVIRCVKLHPHDGYEHDFEFQSDDPFNWGSVPVEVTVRTLGRPT